MYWNHMGRKSIFHDMYARYVMLMLVNSSQRRIIASPRGGEEKTRWGFLLFTAMRLLRIRLLHPVDETLQWRIKQV